MTERYYKFKNYQNYEIVAKTEHEAKLFILAAKRILDKNDTKTIEVTNQSFDLEMIEEVLEKPLFGFYFELKNSMLETSNFIAGLGVMSIPYDYLIQTIENSQLVTGAPIDVDLPAND